MRYIICLVIMGALCSLSPNVYAVNDTMSYAGHNATRDTASTIADIKARGNWKSFSNAMMLRYDEIVNVDDVESALLSQNARVILCGESSSINTAGVVNGSTGSYSWVECRPGEYLVFLYGKFAFSLYCGNPVIDTRNVYVMHKQEVKEADTTTITERDSVLLAVLERLETKNTTTLPCNVSQTRSVSQHSNTIAYNNVPFGNNFFSPHWGLNNSTYSNTNMPITSMGTFISCPSIFSIE